MPVDLTIRPCGGRQAFLCTDEDMKWLKEVHLPFAEVMHYAVAVLTGNEDCPEKIELYARNHIGCRPRVYTWFAAGQMYLMARKGHPHRKRPILGRKEATCP